MAEKLLRDKLGYKAGQAVLLLDLPAGIANPFGGVEHTLASSAYAPPDSQKLDPQKFNLVLGFAHDRAALEVASKVILASVDEDTRVWLVYPKKSGRLKTDLTRDIGWEPMFDAGWIVVSIVSVDETWSAVRFRLKHLVKSIRC